VALVECKKCGNQISDKSNKCVNCGYPLKKLKKNHSILFTTIIICILLILLAIILKFILNNNDRNRGKVNNSNNSFIFRDKWFCKYNVLIE